MNEPVKLPVEVGQTVAGKYLIERVLGIGGMGVVLAATHVGLGQRVAIKFLLPEARAVSGMFMRFANEARASARLKSDHVTRILDVGALDDGTPYMVMEYLEGKDLAAILAERGRISVHEACDYALQACEALAEAHARGIVHRDLKPGNLFVARTAHGTDIVKLLDFGISKHVAPEGTDFSLTKTSAVLGSPLYMPPEQMSSARDVDSRADLWSLGIVLYEAVTGTMPFEGLTLTAIVANIIQEPPKPMAESGTFVPPGFEELVHRCLEKSPSRRFATVGELARALAPFAPRSSSPSIDRISRLESTNPKLNPPQLPPDGKEASQTKGPSEPPPMQLVRVRRVATVVKARPPPVAAVTNAAHMLPARRTRRLTDRLSRAEEPSRGPRWLIVLLLLTGAGLGGVLFMRARTGPAVPVAAVSIPARPPEPPIADATTAAAPATDGSDAAMPAPPATFSAESQPAPQTSGLRGSPVRGPGAGDRRKGPAADEPVQPPPVAAPPPPPPPPRKPAPRTPNIDMEPK